MRENIYYARKKAAFKLLHCAVKMLSSIRMRTMSRPHSNIDDMLCCAVDKHTDSDSEWNIFYPIQFCMNMQHAY